VRDPLEGRALEHVGVSADDNGFRPGDSRSVDESQHLRDDLPPDRSRAPRRSRTLVSVVAVHDGDPDPRVPSGEGSRQ
jgi:hypothetical protein